jgi:hypothetical protein
MTIDDIKNALATNDIGEKRRAFRALVDYPKEEDITGLATAGNVTARVDS